MRITLRASKSESQTKRGYLTCLVLIAFVAGNGCATKIPKEALQLDAQSLELRQTQTRRFDTGDEARVLSASAALLQDLGFSLDESETKLGLIVASKKRSAVEAGQVVAAVLVAAFTGVATPTDKEQVMRASVVTKPHGERQESIAVRVTFQRIVWNTQGQISKQEGITDAEFYQEFFTKLSKSLFLEDHAL